MRVTTKLVFFPAVALPNNKQLCISNKALIIRPNTTYRYSIIVQHVSAVQISLHQVDVGYTKRNVKGVQESRCMMHKRKYEGRERESRCRIHEEKYEGIEGE
jgi:hypothetical protein